MVSSYYSFVTTAGFAAHRRTPRSIKFIETVIADGADAEMPMSESGVSRAGQRSRVCNRQNAISTRIKIDIMGSPFGTANIGMRETNLTSVTWIAPC